MKRMRQKTTCLIPTQTEKQPKTKNKPAPTPEHRMRKHWTNPSSQRTKNGPVNTLKQALTKRLKQQKIVKKRQATIP
jgi:hypothetical protein